MKFVLVRSALSNLAPCRFVFEKFAFFRLAFRRLAYCRLAEVKLVPTKELLLLKSVERSSAPVRSALSKFDPDTSALENFENIKCVLVN